MNIIHKKPFNNPPVLAFRSLLYILVGAFLFLSIHLVTISQSVSALSDAQIKQDALKACNTNNANDWCVVAYIEAFNGEKIKMPGAGSHEGCLPFVDTSNQNENACKHGVNLGQAAQQQAQQQGQGQGQGQQQGQQGQGRVNPNASGCKGGSGQCGSTCGSGDSAYTPVIDIGCKGQGNPIMDSLFGIIRYISDGVGLVVVGSIIVGGIQYSASRGDPQATALAINRIRSSLIALLIYIFAYAFLNYILPGFVL